MKRKPNLEFRTAVVGRTPMDSSSIAVVGNGKRTYLWMGIGGEVATLEGENRLRRFAEEILRRLPVVDARGAR